MEKKYGAADRDTLIREYLKANRILIVDQNSSARTGLKKLFVGLGSPVSSISQASSLEMAEQILASEKPQLVLCEFQVGSRFGLELLQKQRQMHPKETRNCIFILVTANTSQSAVAQAAEEDIDAFILKPYTIENFTVSLAKTIETKLYPSQYLKLINEGKELLELGKFDDAISLFESAMKVDSKPSLACFYEGLVHFQKSYFDGSRDSYEKGLSFNKIHYKCLVGLFDLLVALHRYEAAYEVVKRIARFFPTNPKRLAMVLRLAIQTRNYGDVENFYQDFLKIEERGDELTKCICAALIVCGKYFFEVEDRSRGVDFLRKAAVSAAGRHVILRNCIEVFVQHRELEEAKAVLKRFAKAAEVEMHYAVSALLVESLEKPAELVAVHGRELLRQGIEDPAVYLVTIEKLESSGHKNAADELRIKYEKIKTAE